MEITVLGAHNLETSTTRTGCILIDGVLALDAGSLCSGLSLDEQKRIVAILITHHHFDHVKDLPMIGLATAFDTVKEVCGLASTLEFVRAHLFDGDIYPKFDEFPSTDKPSFRMRPLEPLRQVQVAGYRVKPVPVKHGSILAAGYEVASAGGSRLFYSGDTGGGMSTCWEHTSPDLFITEVSMHDGMVDTARAAGHLTPALLEQELVEFRRIKGYLPRVLVVHMGVAAQKEIRASLSQVARRLGAEITPGRRGLRLSV